MKIEDFLSEKRRNPEQNPKEDVISFLGEYKDNPKAYLHTAPLRKVGIYPRSSSGHDSPAGIYAYRLMDIWDTIEWWNTGNYKRGIEFLPYSGGDHLFILESDIDPDFPADYSADDLKQDMEKLQTLYGISPDDMKRLTRTAKTNLNFRNCPAGYLWGITKAMIAGVSEFDEYTPVNTRAWNSLLRKLGYVGFNDPGMGVIHSAEPTQAVFLTASAFRVTDYMMYRKQQKSVEIGGTKFKGGRLPKDLHMTGIPNTLFYNYSPADFAKVHSWTVDGISLHDIQGFARFVPWNGVGIIKTLAIGTAANESYELGAVQKFFEHYKLPKNIKIKNIYVGGRYPSMFMKYIPENFPVDTITMSRFASTAGIDKLPEAIQAKIKQN